MIRPFPTQNPQHVSKPDVHLIHLPYYFRPQLCIVDHQLSNFKQHVPSQHGEFETMEL